MGLFGNKSKEKTELDLIEDQLKFWRSKCNDTFSRTDAISRIKELENHLIKMHSLKIPERMKAVVESGLGLTDEQNMPAFEKPQLKTPKALRKVRLAQEEAYERKQQQQQTEPESGD